MQLGLQDTTPKEQEEALGTDHKGKMHKGDPTTRPEEPSDEELIEALFQYDQDIGRQQQPSAAEHYMTTAPDLQIPGLLAYHICPAMHLDGSGKCLSLLPYPRTWQTHCPCGHSQAAGNGVLVHFWLAGERHVCLTTTPNSHCYQRTTQQLGEPAPHTKHIARRLAATTVYSTAKRSGRHTQADTDTIVCRNGNMCIRSAQVLQSLAQLTWDEIVLASSRLDFKV